MSAPEFVTAIEVRVGDRIRWDGAWREVVDWKASDRGRYLIVQMGPSKWRQIHYGYGQRLHAQLVEHAR